MTYLNANLHSIREFLMTSSIKNSPERFKFLESSIEKIRKHRKVLDSEFDYSLFPNDNPIISSKHWSPIPVIQKSIQMLKPDESSTILDVGSGCGKFCLVGSLLSPAKFTGVELRESLYRISIDILENFSFPRVRFLNINMIDLDWSEFNMIYLFNPFYENIYEFFRIDENLDFGPNQYAKYTATVSAKLRLVTSGTKVLTYHGFGGDFPNDFYCIDSFKIGKGELDLWIKE